jgi:hypothetical protein
MMVNPTVKIIETAVLNKLMKGVYLLWFNPNDWKPDWNPW